MTLAQTTSYPAKLTAKPFTRNLLKCWSGRRESNPCMQLGELSVLRLNYARQRPQVRFPATLKAGMGRPQNKARRDSPQRVEPRNSMHRQTLGELSWSSECPCLDTLR